MRRHPFLLAFLVLGLGLAGVVIYFTAQMRMRTPPQMVVVREEWMPRGNVPNAYLRIHYEMKNTTLFPVRVHQVDILGPECLFGGDIDAIYPDKDALLLKPGHVHKGSINISLPDGESSMDAAFRIQWEPGVAPRLRPLLYRLDDTYREVAQIPSDPFTPAGSPPAPPSMLELREDVLKSMRIERPRSTTP